MRVFVTGATGFIGLKLVAALASRGDSVVALTRSAVKGRSKLPLAASVVEGEVARPSAWMDAIEGCDAVVNLAGEPVAGRRWTPEVKRRIHDSRVLGTRSLVDAILRSRSPPLLLNASAVGIYGARGDEEIDETAPHGSDYLASVCAAWESEAMRAEARTRVAILRIGPVLGEEGGALAKMVLPFKLFAGGALGSGRQWISWIHLDDLVGLVLHALSTPAVKGPLNATAPHPVTMKEFARALGRTLDRPSWARVPGFALRVALGEAAEVVLDGQRVLPRRALSFGYRFGYETVEVALGSLLSPRGRRA